MHLDAPKTELTVVVPCYNEKDNIAPLVDLLETALDGIDWEVLFVDDDSPDGTAREVRRVARENGRVRLLHRVGRRGLSGACIEGISSSTSQIVAVMDGDLQHDETRLAEMFGILARDPSMDVVVGSRHVAGGSAHQGLSAVRKAGSDLANGLARKLLRITTTDPMSGFFMLRRARFNEVAPRLQKQGFKILADMLAAARGRWKVAEVGYEFRSRQHGESKMDAAVTMEFLGLIIARLTGGRLSIRFILYMLVGISGVMVQLAVVWAMLGLFGDSFTVAQSIGVFVAINTNFVLNNLLTYRDRALRGAEFFKGLLSYYVVCAVGSVANVAVANLLFAVLPIWSLASFGGALMGAMWNFGASALVTWKVR